MKHIFAIVAAFLLLLVTLTVLAQGNTGSPAVVLQWDPVPGPQMLGYQLYYGSAPHTYTNRVLVIGVTNTTCQVSNLVRNLNYYFAVTSIASNGLESAYSGEVSYGTLALPSSPTNVTVTTSNL